MSLRTSLVALVVIALVAAMAPFAASAQQPPAPRIEFRGVGQVIPFGDTTPSTADGTDFGSTMQGEPVMHLFTVSNAGNADLVINAIGMPSDFSFVSPGLTLPATLQRGVSITLMVTCDATTVATVEDFISFSSNDPVNNRGGFTVVCRVNGAPEIDVAGNFSPIADGSTTPSATNGTEFGSVLLNAPLTNTFRVANRGLGTLTTGAVTVPAGFTALNTLPATIPSGGSADLQVRCNAASENTYAGDVSIVNNDQDENPFNFRVHCVVGDGLPDFNPGQDDLPPATSTVTAPPIVVVTPPPVVRNPNTGGSQGGSDPSPAATVVSGGSIVNQVPTAPLATSTPTPRAAATAAPTTPPSSQGQSQGIFRPPATGDAGLASGRGVIPSWLEVAVAGTFVVAVALAAIRIRARS